MRTAVEYECRFCHGRIHSNGTYWLIGADGWECPEASGGHAPIVGKPALGPVDAETGRDPLTERLVAMALAGGRPDIAAQLAAAPAEAEADHRAALATPTPPDPADSPAEPSVETAWTELTDDLFDVGMTTVARHRAIDKHRPLIEAALRASVEPTPLDVEALRQAIEKAAAQDHTADRTYWPAIIATEYAAILAARGQQ